MKAFWLALASHLWQSTIVLVVVAIVVRALRRAPAWAQDALWSAALLKLLLPASFLALLFGPLLSRWNPGAGASSVADAYALVVRVASPDLGSATPAPTDGAGLTGWALLTVAWGIVAGVLVLFWWRRASRMADDGEPLELAPEPLREKVVDAMDGTGLDAARVRLHKGAITPSLRGIRRPMLLLSEDIVRTLPTAELRAVVLHEEAHRRRRDVLRRWVERTLASLLFFYPPVWWLLRRLDQTAELACDEAVLQSGIEPHTYARALARTVRLRLTLVGVPAMGGDGSNLAARMRRIAAHETSTLKAWHRIALATCLAVVAVMVLVPLAGAGSPLASAGTQEQVLVTASVPEPGAEVQAAAFAGLDGADHRVTLEFRETPVREALDRLADLAGFEVRYETLPGVTVTLAVRRTSVAEVLALIAGRAGVSIEVAGSGTLVVRPEDGPRRLGGSIEEPQRIRYVPPEYPELARRARLEGVVVLRIVIDEQGRVEDAEVLRPLGLGLDEAAVEAVRQWRYTPTRYNGRPVELVLTVTVQFELLDSEPGRPRQAPEDAGSDVVSGQRDQGPEASLHPRVLVEGGWTPVGDEVAEPERVHYVSPRYPQLARRAGLEGVVVLEAVIATDGSVREARVLRHLGLGLDEAAREAVEQWRYTPTLLDGRPVEVAMPVTVQFELVR